MRFRDRLYRFMQGRYGADQLSKFLLALMVAIWILSMILGIPGRHNLIFFTISSALSYLSIIIIIICWFRMFSKNIPKRYRENQKYLKRKSDFLSLFGRGAGSDMYNRVFKCPKCKQKVRVPKGKGKIAIRCPKCSNEFIRRT